LDKCHAEVIALRDIQPEEEIFCSYGGRYWGAAKLMGVEKVKVKKKEEDNQK